MFSFGIVLVIIMFVIVVTILAVNVFRLFLLLSGHFLINFYDFLINIKNAKYNFLNQYLVIYKNLMASEAQYYQAKVFLKSYNEALQTLE